MRYLDTVYLGHEVDLRDQFERSISERFPSGVRLDVADDSIKGYRYEVSAEESVVSDEDYFVWVMVEGWLGVSLNVSLEMESPSSPKMKEFIKGCVGKANEILRLRETDENK